MGREGESFMRKFGAFSKRTQSVWWLCGCLSAALSCAGQTQPLNEVDESSGGSGGTGSSSGGSGGGSTASGVTGASGGSGGTSPASGTSTDGSGGTGGTSSHGAGFREEPMAPTSKLDLLFVVDNSINMADKQEYLAHAAPKLIEQLADPPCIDDDGQGGTTEGCPEGQRRLFAPVEDMHVGIITSSLGSHGGEICGPTSLASFNPTQNDAGRLLPTVREPLAEFADPGFLLWDPSDAYEGGEDDLEQLKAALQEHLVNVGENGCGYEAPLEAMYRFLIEPTPPANIVSNGSVSGPELDANGNVLVDGQVLAQRSDFLRPDSAVAVVILSDENDCSVADSGLGFLTSTATTANGAFTMPPATEACDTEPNDPCCRSCALSETAPPAGCAPLNQDPKCSAGRSVESDSLNLRCYDQKRRFGFDMLYPVERYVDGLTRRRVVDTHHCSQEDDCPLVDNPLFEGESRTPRGVFVLSLVGVPWQDLATENSLSGGELTYQAEEGALGAAVWDLIVGDPSRYVAPEDPFMIESVQPRTGQNPVTGEALASADSTDPQENSINGHESRVPYPVELQSACIFPLRVPRDCSGSGAACSCTAAELEQNSALCQPPEGGAAETVQYFARATPGLRQLELMSELPHGIPASICPKLTSGDESEPSFGYNPAMRALLRNLASVLEP